MDNLYDNLENYEDVNIIEDLKNENKELKAKVEQYSTAMFQLQKDFDKLSSEYKKLEINYSSLLKTARAEIERKTQIITNLNIEKDMLVINTMQTRGKNFLNNIKKSVYTGNNACNSKGKPEERERRKSPDRKTPKIEYDNNIKKTNDVQSSQNCETKENMPDKQQQTVRTQKIGDRRKSVPATSKFIIDEKTPVWSSDEDDLCNPLRNQWSSNADFTDRKNNRMSDTSSTDNRQSYHNPLPRDSRFRGRYGRSDENYRSNDRYEPRRNRRYPSPERSSHSRGSDRYDYGRQRSPPSDRYRRNKSRDRRSHYLIDHPREEYSPQHQSEKHAVKHKMQSQLDEPNHKKLRIDSYGEYVGGNRVYERENFDPLKSLIPPDDPYRSCQSPDQVTTEIQNQPPVKEIKPIAAVPLEDPRTTSKKYVLKTENNKPVFTTCTGSEIEIKPVDKSLWQLPKVPVPKALLEKPSSPTKCNNLIDKVYMNIDKPNFDISLESGEIPTLEDEALLPTKYETVKPVESNRKNQLQGIKVETSTDTLPNSSSNKYVIPKLSDTTQKRNIKQENSNVPNEDVKSLKSHKEELVSKESPPKKNKEQSLLETCEIKSKNEHVSNENVYLKDIPKQVNPTDDNNDKDKLIEAHNSMGTVERDLLLSDDASDSIDLLKQPQTVEDRNKNSSNKSNIEVMVDVSECDKLVKGPKNKIGCLKDKGVEDTSIKKSDTSSRNKRTRKKSETKTKEQNKDTATKKTKNRKENKVENIKNKFSDLFGESSSLIMPEDLGINAAEVVTTIKNNQFESIFDDTQSAMDIQLLQKQANNNKSKDNDETVCIEKDKVRSEVSPLKTDTGGDNPKSEQLSENNECNNDNTVLYKNLNADVSMDGSNVVIISTGVQQTHVDNVKTHDNMDTKKVPPKSYLPTLKALATSTPLKINETTNCDLSNNGSTQPSNTIDSSSNSNTVEQMNDPEVPDIRIFVKRRRKVKK